MTGRSVPHSPGPPRVGTRQAPLLAHPGGAVQGNDRLRLSPHVESVRAGRHFVQRTLARWHLEDLVDVATLLTSEAVTNAVVHAATPVLLDVYTREQLVIEVSDHDTTAVLPPVAAGGIASLPGAPAPGAQ